MERREIQFLIVILTVVLIVLVGSIIALTNYVMRKRVEFVRNEERARAEHEEAILQVKIEIAEEQNQALSMELHDNIGQLLSVASMELEMLNKSSQNNELQEIKELVSSSLVEIRAVSRGLNTQLILESSLYDMILKECERINRLKLCSAKVESGDVFISPNEKIVIFRIFQEFISNSLKYSKANNIEISMTSSQFSNVFIAKDDGIGFDPKQVYSNNGLVNMEHRASLIGAEYLLESQEGEGCMLTLRLPINTTV